MKYSIFIVAFFFVNSVFAQFLLLPGDFLIDKKPRGFMAELALLPNKSFSHNSEYPKFEAHYEKLLNNKMNKWILEKFPDSKIYNNADSIVDVRKLQTLIHLEQLSYHTLKRRPIFGYSGTVPTEGDYTKKEINKLKLKYDIDYVVLVSVQSLYAGTSEKYEFPNYLGHTTFYAWIVDAESGYIEKELVIEAREKTTMTTPQLDLYKPMKIKVDDKFVSKNLENIQKKLRKKLRAFN